MLSFVSSSYEHPLTVSWEQIRASLAVKGSLTDQRAQCEHAHLLFLSNTTTYSSPPFPSLPSPLPHPPTSHLSWGAKGARRKNTHVVRVTCECPDSAETSLVALLKQLFRQDRAWVRWCPGSWLNGDDCAAARALLSVSKRLICGSKLWFPLPLTSLTLRVFTPEIMPYSMLSSRLSQISLEQK